VILSRVRETSHGDVAITNGLDLEDTTSLGDLVERTVDRLQQSEHLRRLSRGAPSREARDIGKENRSLGEQVSDWLGLVHEVVVDLIQTRNFTDQKFLEAGLVIRIDQSCLFFILSVESIAHVGRKQGGHNCIRLGSFPNDLGVSTLNETIVHEENCCHEQKRKSDCATQNCRKVGSIVLFELLSGKDMERVNAVSHLLSLGPRRTREWKDDFHITVALVVKISWSNIESLRRIKEETW